MAAFAFMFQAVDHSIISSSSSVRVSSGWCRSEHYAKSVQQVTSVQHATSTSTYVYGYVYCYGYVCRCYTYSVSVLHYVPARR